MFDKGKVFFKFKAAILPSESTIKISNLLSAHFKEVVEIDPESAKAISEYLKNHAADNSCAKLSRKIGGSIGNRTPIRITEIPCIQEEHDEISSKVFQRKSIGSFSNCIACHKTVERGIYGDDAVTIPK